MVLRETVFDGLCFDRTVGLLPEGCDRLVVIVIGVYAAL
jgi:hypothetical protein